VSKSDFSFFFLSSKKSDFNCQDLKLLARTISVLKKIWILEIVFGHDIDKNVFNQN